MGLVPGPSTCVSRNEVPPDLSRLYVTTSFHPVVGLPIAFLSLRKDSPFKSWVFPQLQSYICLPVETEGTGAGVGVG